MRVYEIVHDCDCYRGFHPEDQGCKAFLNMDGTPRLTNWKPPEVFIDLPKLKSGNFYNVNGAALIADEKATEALRPLFEKAGELLPLEYKGRRFTVLNVTTVADSDCVDEEASKWFTGSEGQRFDIIRYVFRAERLLASPIFKFPYTKKTSTFLTEGLLDPAEEFRAIVHSEGLKGLLFKEHWSSDLEDWPSNQSAGSWPRPRTGDSYYRGEEA